MRKPKPAKVPYPLWRQAALEQPPAIAPESERLLSTRDVLARVPVHRDTLYEMVKAGRFPRPLHPTGGRKTAWRLSDVHRWMIEHGRAG